MMLSRVIGIVFKLWTFIRFLLTPITRLFCWIKRRRKDSGTILPLVNKNATLPEYDFKQAVPTNDCDLQLEPWDIWDGATSSAHNMNHNSSRDLSRSQHGHHITDSGEAVSDIDYFGDMQPTIKRSRKIFIKKSSDVQSTPSDRLSASLIAPVQSELVEWDEGESGWDEGVDEDLSEQADLALKERKRVERDRRHIENVKRKMEKQNRSKADHFTAVKIS